MTTFGRTKLFRMTNDRGGSWPVQAGAVAAMFAAGMIWSAPASAEIGDSFIKIPAVDGRYRGAEHKGWIRVESNVWSNRTNTQGMGGFGGAMAGGAKAPRPGTPAKLHFMLSKSNPDTALLMRLCTSKVAIPELTYSEPWGSKRPATAPAFVQYKLKNATITDCPVLAEAPGQGFVLTFQDIEWLNQPLPPPGRPQQGAQAVQEAPVRPVWTPAEPGAGKKVKSYLVTWLGMATDARPGDCPAMNAKPTEADYYRYRSEKEVAETRTKLGERGVGASAFSEWRGPGNLNAVLLPAIVPDPGLQEPRGNVALGLNLDNDEGRGSPPRGIRKHKNYTSPDGRTGVDNQMFTVLGCIPGYRGKAGYRMQTDNARRADGNIVTLIEVSGIDDERNDPEVEVALVHARDKPIKDNAGKVFIPNYTFRPTDEAAFANHNVRVKGRIVNGVVETDVLPKYPINSGQGPIYDLFKARLRISPLPDGGITAFLGGYLDWRYYSSFMASGYSEGLFGFQFPAVYAAMKRHADGLYDPATGEYQGISAAYQLDGIPAFLTPVTEDGK